MTVDIQGLTVAKVNFRVVRVGVISQRAGYC